MRPDAGLALGARNGVWLPNRYPGLGPTPGPGSRTEPEPASGGEIRFWPPFLYKTLWRVAPVVRNPVRRGLD